ncbi:MAG TPA: monovalent cation/H(+) antiporter subunit G [Caldimonas sp.]
MSQLAGVLDGLVAALLLASGLLSLVAALGLLRLKNFFQRMHAPALAITFGSWCAALAAMVYFFALASRPALHTVLIVILLAVTAPVTTTLLARATQFRRRAAAAAEQERGESARDG